MLQLKNVDKSFGTKQVAQNISLSVEGGGVLAVLGKSGCGKSTLLKIIAGLTPADGGEVWLNGCDITLMPSEKRNISLMFQDYALFPHLNAWQNAAFGLKMRKVPRKRPNSGRGKPWTKSDWAAKPNAAWTACPAANSSASHWPAHW